MKELYELSNAKVEVLAAVPHEVAHFSCDTLFERRVQAEVVELLLLSPQDGHFTSCVLVHGMGGTGKVRGLETDRPTLAMSCGSYPLLSSADTCSAPRCLLLTHIMIRLS